ncbi:hypothetical protein ACS0TY_024603 [Phlomoides rotata]
MDSTSSSMTIVNRDESPLAVAGEDDGALLVAVGRAKEAAVLFQNGKFLDCLKILNQLLQKKDGDLKIRHNVAIAESLQDGCSDPKRLIKALENIKKQSDELARASGEHFEAPSNNGSEHTASMRGNNAAVHPSSSVVYSDEFDTSVAVFNIAVVWYHLHEYTRSFSYLDALYQNIEPICEGTALRICLLLVDVALLSHNASRSADVISYMEKVFFVNALTNQIENGTSTQQQPLLVSKSMSLPNHSTIPDASHSDSTANTSEDSLTRTLSEEAIEDEPLPLLSSLEQNFQRLGISSANDVPRIQAEESISTADLRLKLHLYKVRLLLLIRNLKAAKREVKMAMNIARGKDNHLPLYLKSQLEYARGNHRKAIKLLMASNSGEVGISSMYYNNLGCIYYRLGKHHTSGIFFSKALSSSLTVRKEKPRKILTLSQDKSILITYNCGIHSLSCGRPLHAARCFQTASLIFYNKPLLWLRIAECCLMALEMGLMKSISSASESSDIRVNVIGKGKWRQLALGYGNSLNGQGKYTGNDSLCTVDGKEPDLSMSLALQSLVNALYLLNASEANYSTSPPTSEESESEEALLSQISNHKNSNGEVKEQKSGPTNSILDYERIRAKEKQMMRQAALADLAFVQLALGNPLKALSTAKSLMKLPECSKMYAFLGTTYAAEALCMLNKPKEADELLTTYLSDGDIVELPYRREDCEKWTVEKVADGDESALNESQVSLFSSPEEARGLFCANYAVNLALLGDVEKARLFVSKALSDIPNSSRVSLTAIYVDLKGGKIEDALAKLRQQRGVRFLPSNLTLNGTS